MTPKQRADVLILGGLGIAVLGIALISIPVALFAGGVGIAAFGALAIQVRP